MISSVLKHQVTHKIMVLALAFGVSLSAMATYFTNIEILAENGFADAQYHLGVMYDIGDGIHQDTATAISCDIYAALVMNDDAALALLGIVIDNG